MIDLGSDDTPEQDEDSRIRDLPAHPLVDLEDTDPRLLVGSQSSSSPNNETGPQYGPLPASSGPTIDQDIGQIAVDDMLQPGASDHEDEIDEDQDGIEGSDEGSSTRPDVSDIH